MIIKSSEHYLQPRNVHYDWSSPKYIDLPIYCWQNHIWTNNIITLCYMNFKISSVKFLKIKKKFLNLIYAETNFVSNIKYWISRPYVMFRYISYNQIKFSALNIYLIDKDFNITLSTKFVSNINFASNERGQNRINVTMVY